MFYAFVESADFTWQALRVGDSNPAHSQTGFGSVPEAMAFAVAYDPTLAGMSLVPLTGTTHSQGRNPIAPLGWESLIPFPEGMPGLGYDPDHTPVVSLSDLRDIINGREGGGLVNGFQIKTTNSPELTDSATTLLHTYTLTGDSTITIDFKIPEDGLGHPIVLPLQTFRRENVKPQTSPNTPDDFVQPQWDPSLLPTFTGDDVDSSHYWHEFYPTVATYEVFTPLGVLWNKFPEDLYSYAVTLTQKKDNDVNSGDPFLLGAYFTGWDATSMRDQYNEIPWGYVNRGNALDFRRIADQPCLFIDLTFRFDLIVPGIGLGLKFTTGHPVQTPYMLYRIYTEVDGWAPTLEKPLFEAADDWTITLTEHTGDGPTIFGVATKAWWYTYEATKTDFTAKFTPTVDITPL